MKKWLVTYTTETGDRKTERSFGNSEMEAAAYIKRQYYDVVHILSVIEA